MIFRKEHHAAAEELVLQDPLIANDCVDWQVCVGLEEASVLSDLHVASLDDPCMRLMTECMLKYSCGNQ